MQIVEETSAFGYVSLQQVGVVPKPTGNLGTAETKLYEMRIDKLRLAIRKNEISFPSQVPTFPKHDRPDLQRKLAQLYFVLGWNGPRIGHRYGLSRLRVHQILSTWTRRAVESGYIQSVPPTGSVKPPFKHPPLQIVLFPVTNHPALSIQSSVACEISAPVLYQNEIPDWADSRKGYRPRRRFETGQIVGVLKELEAGRTVADLAAEVGVSTSTIRTWRRQHQMHLLRRENTHLKEQIEKLSASEAMLIDPITRSDGLQRPAFMPC
jgi:hypothetical protein